MERTRMGSLGVGAVGALATHLAVTPGQYALSAGVLELDPYYVLLGGFCFLFVWGLWALLAEEPTRSGV